MTTERPRPSKKLEALVAQVAKECDDTDVRCAAVFVMADGETCFFVGNTGDHAGLMRQALHSVYVGRGPDIESIRRRGGAS